MAKGYDNLSGLTSYVEEKKDVIVRDILLKGETIEHLSKQLGIKTSEKIHPFEYEAVLQDGEGCGFSAQGATNITEREIDTAIFKVNDEFCPDDLLGKLYEYMVRIGANANAENMPFEQEVIDGVVKSINKQLDKLVWQGDKSASGSTDLIDGFLTQAEGADSASTVTATTASGASVYDAVKLAYTNIPEQALDNAVIFISPANFRALGLELVENFKYNASLFENGAVEIKLPGTDTTIRKTSGLAGVNDKVYAAAWNNMFYGCDALNDKEEVRLWFSDDDDVFKLKVKFNAGVKTLFPDEVVVVTIA